MGTKFHPDLSDAAGLFLLLFLAALSLGTEEEVEQKPKFRKRFWQFLKKIGG